MGSTMSRYTHLVGSTMHGDRFSNHSTKRVLAVVKVLNVISLLQCILKAYRALFLSLSFSWLLNMDTFRSGAQTSRYNRLVTAFVALGSFVRIFLGSLSLTPNSCVDLWILCQHYRLYYRAARLVRLLQFTSTGRAGLRGQNYTHYCDRKWVVFWWRSAWVAFHNVVGGKVWKETQYPVWVLRISFRRRFAGWCSNIGVGEYLRDC
jgi:hypothetical protein